MYDISAPTHVTARLLTFHQDVSQHEQDGSSHGRGGSLEYNEKPPPTEAMEPTADETPTEEEMQTLRRVPDKIPLRVYSIAYVEMVERLSYYGCTNIFVNFIQQPRPTPTGAALHPNSAQAQPGALGLGQQTSTGLTTSVSYRLSRIVLR